jgi:hypothetical protein
MANAEGLVPSSVGVTAHSGPTVRLNRRSTWTIIVMQVRFGDC